MKKCKICNSTADKAGSHLVPHFLLKRIDTEIGKKGRDKELGFVISAKGSSSYFGRGTSYEKLNEIFGEIDDDRIAKNQHPLIEDYIFCTRCEEELAKLESNYSTSINHKSLKSAINYSSKIKSLNALLFWISVIFRSSISENYGVKILPEHEELLRIILFDFFTKDSIHEDIKRIRYKLFRACDYSVNNSTNFHINPEQKNPYLLIVDEYIIVFSIDCEPSINEFYEIKLPSADSIENNNDEKDESIYSLDYNIFSNLAKVMFDKLASQYNTTLYEQCDLLYVKLGLGISMPLKMKEEILKKLINDTNISFGDRHSINHKSKIIIEVITKYFD